MPEQVRCPSCNAALRVPDNLLGKNVKCPKCQTTFLAETEEPAESERIVREPRQSAARRRPRPPEDIEEEEDLPPEDELEEVPEEEYDERPRRRRRGRRRAEAESAVAGPAISLIVLGSLDIALVILNVILSLAGFNLVPAGARGAGGPGANPAFAVSPALAIPGQVLGLCCAVAILTGGLRMKQLQSYGLAMTASILALLPCGNCCCIGLPLGIWALVALNKPGVKDAFR